MKVLPPKENQNKGPLSDDFRRDLRKRKLCFTCQEPWAPGNRCAAGKAHYIEVFSDSEEEEEEEREGDNNVVAPGEDPPPPRGGNGAFSPIGGALASLRGVPKYLNLRVQGTTQG